MHQLPYHTAEAVHKPLILACQLCNGRLVLNRYIAGLLEEAPTQFPSRLGQCHAGLILLCFTTRLARPARGEQRFFEVPPDILDCMEMVGLKAGMRPYRGDRFGEALGVVREGRGDIEAQVFDVLQKLGRVPIFPVNR